MGALMDGTGRKVAIMQPYFLPYIGYFQLIASVDVFVAYDNIKYTKKGWINRNRMLQGGKDAVFSLPLRGGSDSLDIRERELAADFDRRKLLNQFRGAYGKAPHFEGTFAMLEKIVGHDDRNLFGYLRHSIATVCDHLGLATEIKASSTVGVDHRSLKGQDKVLAICEAMGAGTYVNAIGGTDLYARDAFRGRGIELKFIQPRPLEYPQFGGVFVPWLSIVDVLMFNPVEAVRGHVETRYDLV